MNSGPALNGTNPGLVTRFAEAGWANERAAAALTANRMGRSVFMPCKAALKVPLSDKALVALPHQSLASVIVPRRIAAVVR